jgi:DNA mismatch repair ATPase MutS
MLKCFLGSPSTSLTDIAARQSLVEFFLRRPHLEADLAQLLTKVDDISRLTQKCLAGRGDPSDLIGIGRTIHTWSKIIAMLDTEKELEKKEQLNYTPEEWRSLDALMSRMHILTELLEAIDNALGVDGENVDRNPEELPFEGDNEFENGPTKLAFWKLPVNRWFVRPE